MQLGFTGTRKGTTKAQHQALLNLVYGLKTENMEAHHGDCVGADSQFDAICVQLGIKRHVWPGIDRYGDSFSRAGCRAETIERPRPYLERDRLIVVHGVDGLIACPQTLKEEIRSGTWTTVRIARRLGRVIWLVYPNGAIVIEDAKGKKMDHGR